MGTVTGLQSALKSDVRVAIVASHPIQHFCPFYRRLAGDGRVALHVIFASSAGYRLYQDPGFGVSVKWCGDLLEGFDCEFLPASHSSGRVDRRLRGTRLWQTLNRLNADVVQIYGLYHWISWKAFIWVKLRRRRLLYLSDSERRHRCGFLSRARRRLMLPLILRMIDGFLTVGDANEEYYRAYGVPQTKSFRCPYPTDVDYFQEAYRERDFRRRSLRSQLHLSQDATVALYVGKLIARKRVPDAIRAIGLLWNCIPRCPVYLMIVGDGPERDACERLASSFGCEAFRFVGFIPPHALADYYLACDVLVHPAEKDPHPLAASEAVLCGLPVVASNCVGSIGPTDDLQPGRNAWVYRVGRVEELAEILRLLATNAEVRAAAAQESLEIGRGRSLELTVEGFVRACYAVVEPKT